MFVLVNKARRDTGIRRAILNSQQRIVVLVVVSSTPYLNVKIRI